MFTLFTGHHVGGQKRSSNMAAPYCNFVRNISTNISGLGRRTRLKLGGLSSLFIVYNVTIFFTLAPAWSFILLFLRDNHDKEIRSERDHDIPLSSTGYPSSVCDCEYCTTKRLIEFIREFNFRPKYY